jgi:hypothetical protein
LFGAHIIYRTFELSVGSLIDQIPHDPNSSDPLGLPELLALPTYWHTRFCSCTSYRPVCDRRSDAKRVPVSTSSRPSLIHVTTRYIIMMSPSTQLHVDLIRCFSRGDGWECRDPVLGKCEPRRRPERNSACLRMLVAIQQLFTPVGKSCTCLFEDLHLQTYLV